jgi:hypothetical protein
MADRGGTRLTLMSDTNTEHSTPSHKAKSQSSLIAPVALLIALAAGGLAGWAVLRGPSQAAEASSTSAPAPTAEQSAQAKTRACGAFITVRNAVSLQTHADAGPDPIAAQAVAANARLAMFGGGSYLLGHLDVNTQPDLSTAIHSFADTLQDISINALAGVPNSDPEQAARLGDAEAASGRVEELCK